MIGPKPFCGIPWCESFGAVSKWVRAEHERRWRLHPYMRKSRIVLQSPSNRVASDLFSLNKLMTSRFIGLITGLGSIFTESASLRRIRYVECVMSRMKLPESCTEAFNNLQLLMLPSLYILEPTQFCVSKCAIHAHKTRGRDNYRTSRHRPVVYERSPSQADVPFINKLPDSIKTAPTPNVLKTHLKRFLVSQTFYNVDEFLAYNWEHKTD
ncbi:hypothetical protein J6590_041618 [Homalodisca vitripennis]|nr:hypothetical protein J6590_041618 [Homalodisca vitripennis]